MEIYSGSGRMTGKGVTLRNVYMRVTIDGVRKYVKIGFISKAGKFTLSKGMPKPEWWSPYGRF